MLEQLKFVLSELFKILRIVINSVLLITFKMIYFKEDKPNPLAPVKSDYLLLPAHILAKKIRDKEVEFNVYTHKYCKNNCSN